MPNTLFKCKIYELDDSLDSNSGSPKKDTPTQDINKPKEDNTTLDKPINPQSESKADSDDNKEQAPNEYYQQGQEDKDSELENYNYNKSIENVPFLKEIPR